MIPCGSSACLVALISPSATGDLYCHVLVETPVNLTDRQKELLEEFERISGESRSSGKARDKSFTDKLRDLFD